MRTQLRSGCVAALALALACAPAPDPDPGGAGLEGLLPAALPEGWSAVAAPVEYDAETLFEYLNGGAPLYLNYGFVRLLHARYQLGEDPFAGLTIDIFEMGSTLGAFGLYSSMRPPDATFKGWGGGGYVSGTVAAAWSGGIFVHGEADEDRPELIAVLEKMLAEIVAGAAGDTAPPAILSSLPADGLVPRSQRYVSTDLFGHAFLPGGVLGSYKIDNRDGKLFFSDLESAAAATAAVAQLRTHQERWGEIVDDGPPIGAGGFRFSDPGLGAGTVVSAGPFVAGVHGDLAPGEQNRLLEEMVSRLEAGL
jgi:hypothetical protein